LSNKKKYAYKTKYSLVLSWVFVIFVLSICAYIFFYSVFVNKSTFAHMDNISYDDSAVEFDYYEYNMFDLHRVVLSISVDDSIVSASLKLDLLDYFEKVLDLFGTKIDQNQDTNNQNSLTFVLDKFDSTQITLQHRDYRAFVVSSQYDVKGFLDNFNYTYNNTQFEDGQVVTNTDINFAKIIKAGYIGESKTILPLAVHSLKASQLVDSAVLNFFLAKDWTIKQGQIVQINGTNYVKLSSKVGSDATISTVVTLNANPIGYTVLTIALGIATVIVLKIIAAKKFTV